MAEGGACYKENNRQLSLSIRVLTCDNYLHLRKYPCIKGPRLALAGHELLRITLSRTARERVSFSEKEFGAATFQEEKERRITVSKWWQREGKC